MKRRPLHLSAISLWFCLGFLSVTSVVKAYDDRDFFPPARGRGNMLIDARNGLGEPLNVIISARSDPLVLTDSGLLNWARSLGLSYECLDIHGPGGWFSADVGDGNGYVRQQLEARQMYSNAQVGTCLETFVGGNHFRSYRQNGPKACTHAIFLGVSHEEDLSEEHTISPNGYDLGRDELVSRATNDTTYFGGITYSAYSEDIEGLLTPGVKYINHDIAIDGIVKMLTISILNIEESVLKDVEDTFLEEGLNCEPGHRESRLILPQSDEAPNEDKEPISGPEYLLSALKSDYGQHSTSTSVTLSSETTKSYT